MPIKGFRHTHCKRGHELTPENRRPASASKRGGGVCLICSRDAARRRNGSPLAGTFADDPKRIARQEARAAKRKICPQCGQAKGWEAYYKDRTSSDGLAGWCRACQSFKKRGGAKAAAKRTVDAYRLREYGVSPERYAEMVAQQGGVCCICRRAPRAGRQLAVDHCHATGKVRGLLCNECNPALGLFHDSQEALWRAIRYLERSASG